MTPIGAPGATVSTLDDGTAALVRLAVTIAVGDESALRDGVARAAASAADPVHVEEVILQSYLFVGFPRALNAMRAWRKATGRSAPLRDDDAAGRSPAGQRVRGEITCATVYGKLYDRLRVNIRELHPTLDDWMIEEGYGRVLGRGALGLRARELCVAAVCAATEQDRQLHSHLHGALHAGASAAEVDAALAIAGERLGAASRERIAHLWARVRAVA